MNGIWSRLSEILERSGRAVLVTVAEVRGSAPREAGARMIVTPEGDYSGTIGGGALEYEAIGMARRRLAGEDQAAILRRMSLGPELAQCCGGSVTLLFESFTAGDRKVGELAAREAQGPFSTHASVGEGRALSRTVLPASESDIREAEPVRLRGSTLHESFRDARQPLLLFGAGHVGRALVLALAPLPFRVTWVDSRPGAFPKAVPGNATLRRLADPVEAVATAEPGSFVLIMTHSHPLDLDLCRAALPDRRIAHVGLIGSATKRARFTSRLRAAGLQESDIARLQCPIGLAGLHDKSPAGIAASVAADLLLTRQAMATQKVVDFGPKTSAPVEGKDAEKIH